MNRGITIERLYKMRCDILTKVKTVNANGETVFTDSLLYHNLPCRLSFLSSPHTSSDRVCSEIEQPTVIFLSVEYNIPESSKVYITFENGLVRKYKSSGMPKLYTFHQQINLINEKDYA